MWVDLPEGFVMPLSPLTAQWSADGACTCCGRRDTMTSGGCTICNSLRTFCGCGAIVACGCGRSGDHTCPNVITAGVTMPISIRSLLDEES